MRNYRQFDHAALVGWAVGVHFLSTADQLSYWVRMKISVIPRLFIAVMVAALINFAVTLSVNARDPDIVVHEPFFFDSNQPEVIVLAGKIDRRAALNFTRIIEASGSAETLLLASPGGVVDIALSISLEIHRLGLTTVITEEYGCHSACAFLFLAGHERIAFGELGVHQISNDSGDLSEGQLALSDVVDILDRFDVPNQMIVDMLRTPADRIHAYSPAQLEALGVTGPRGQASAPESSRQPPPFASEIGEEALLFVAAVNASWSRDNSQAVQDLSLFYAQQVMFYGEEWTRERVVEHKRAFALRWPVRDYRLDRNNTHAECSQNDCRVVGIVHWRAHSPSRNASSSGTAEIDLRLTRVDGTFVIRSEDGRVVSRD